MALRKIAFVICLVILILSLVSGYIIAGQWIGAVIAIIIGSAWLLAKKYPDSSLLFICLLLSVCLAVAGRLIGSPPLLMICSSGAALVVWDLLFLDRALGKRTLEEQTRRFEHQHLQSLMIAVGVGLLMAFFGRLLNLQLPFAILIFFVALATLGLDRVWGYLKKRNIRS